MQIIICFLSELIPLFVLDLPFWADILILLPLTLFQMFLPVVPELGQAALWIAGLCKVIGGVQTGWSIAYYVCFGIAMIWLIFLTLFQLGLFSGRRNSY